MKPGIFWLALANLLALSFAPACSSDKKTAIAMTEVGGDCLVNSDCSAPLVCTFQRCHVECVTTRDCDGTLRCVGAHEASRVCQLDIEASCKTLADCASGLVCSSDGSCRDHCEADDECIGDQVCTQGACAEPAELDASGKLPVELCHLSSDCPSGQRCAAGSCVAECVTDRDCALGQACDAGACRAVVGSECQADDECPRAGASCLEGKCHCQCLADVDCNGGETCDGCACQPPPAPECQSSTDCEDGKQCHSGACDCSCVTDRDCERGFSCDGCACIPPVGPTTIHDATIKDSNDLALMRGITTVETKLLLTSNTLTTTSGLESLTSVGSLELQSLWGLDPQSPNPFAGLSNLTLIDGDFEINNVPITSIELNPKLRITGKVLIHYTQMTCETLYALQQLFAAHGPITLFDAPNNGDCSQGACSLGQCWLIPTGGPSGPPGGGPPPGGP